MFNDGIQTSRLALTPARTNENIKFSHLERESNPRPIAFKITRLVLVFIYFYLLIYNKITSTDFAGSTRNAL